LRIIAEEVGVSEKQVRNDLQQATAEGYAVEPVGGKVQGRDGKKRPAKKPKPKKPPKPKTTAPAREKPKAAHDDDYSQLLPFPGIEATTSESEPAPEPAPNAAEPDPDTDPEARKIRRKGVALAQSAIKCLARIPKNDALRKRGFEIVRDWIDRNE
jgi:hypothetical protein